MSNLKSSQGTQTPEVKVAKTVEKENDDKELDLKKYDGICEKCSGRTRSDKDHIEDLIGRVTTSKKKYASLLLRRHWPHFSDHSRHMQFFCHVCKLHFKGSCPLTVHLHRNQSAKGFKEDGFHQIKWTPEIGKKHKEELAKFVKLIQRIDKEGPNVAQLPDLKEFLCARSPRYYEMPFRTGNFTEYDDAALDDFMLLEYQTRKVLGDNPEAYEVIDTEETDNRFGPVAIQERLEQVLSGKIPRVFPLDEGENHSMETDDKETVVQEKKVKTFNKVMNAFICPQCNVKGPSVRHHVNNFLWIESHEKEVLGRMSHINYYLNYESNLGGLVGDYDPLKKNCIVCPLCSQHMCMRKGYQQIFFHLRKLGLPSMRKTTKFIRDHAELMNIITDLFVARINGDVNGAEIIKFLNNKFLCREGSVYYTGPGPDDLKDKPKSAIKRKWTTVSGPTPDPFRSMPIRVSGGQMTGPRMPMRSGPMPVPSRGVRPGFMGVRPAAIRGPQVGMRPPVRGAARGGFQHMGDRHQQVKRFRGESVPYGQPGPHSRGPMGMAPRSLVSGGPSNLRFRGSGPGVGTERMGSGSNFPCELCGFQAGSHGGLFLHLSGALFKSNRNSVRSHLLSFSEDFIYNVACSCPSCGQRESSFANCLQHLGLMGVRNPQHQVEAEALANQFMRCMSGAIDFDGVTRYIETSFQMRGRRM